MTVPSTRSLQPGTRGGRELASPDRTVVLRAGDIATVCLLHGRGLGAGRGHGGEGSKNLLSPRPSAQASALFLAVQSDLLVTEGARRRLRIELQREQPEEPPSVAIMRHYRSVLREVDHASPA